MKMLMLLALAGVTPVDHADLRRSIDTYAGVARTAVATGDRTFMPIAALNVCRYAFAATLADGNSDAAKIVAAYDGPEANGLKMRCVAYFDERAGIMDHDDGR